MADFESELNLLRRRVDSTQGDRDKDKKELERLTDALNRARTVRLDLFNFLEVYREH